VLEHVRDRARAMKELGRCLRPNGAMVHLMPSPTWKMLQLALYYPHVVVSGLEYIGAERQLPAAKPATDEWRDAGAKPSWWVEFKRGVLPQVHGEYPGHVRELFGFRARAWRDAFVTAGFEVRAVKKLPLYSGYGFGLERMRRLGEKLGFSAHNAFVVTHPGAQAAFAEAA
jgi:hypothetical protein